MIDKRDYLIILYDYYSSLLNDKQREYFEEYYFNNLSLSEISDNLNISRNAVHKMLKNISNKLIEYENNLKLYEKNNKMLDLISKINDEEIQKEITKLL